jgi:hypothetical protein
LIDERSSCDPRGIACGLAGRRRAGAAMLRLPCRWRPDVSAPGEQRPRDGRPYFLVVGFLAVGWQHEDEAGLAELVLGLLPVIAGLLLVIAGLGVPFHGCIASSSMAPPGIEGRIAGPVCIRVVNFLFRCRPR